MTKNNQNRIIIAEIGSVHDGSIGNAIKAIDLAKDCGADVVKFQTHDADSETTKSAPNPKYFNSESRYEYFKRTSFKLDEWIKLRKHAKEKNILFSSSPFSIKSLDLLLRIKVDFIKIASGEVTNLPLLNKIAKSKIPIILSTGMSSWNEINSAYEILKNNKNLTIMQCSSIYPCPAEKTGLNILDEIKKKFPTNIGFSDHTPGIAASIAAASMGANVIEKHLTFSKHMYGSDASNALEPKEFQYLTNSLRFIWKAIDNPVNKDDLKTYKSMKKIFEKSIVTSKNLKKGDIINNNNISLKKPGTGLNYNYISQKIGKKTKRNLPKDTLISLKDIF